ncbi:fasciclin domain-containing protein [Fibrisoma montanum]|uniref:Fasciclin domain-containing protein n=1 Tax=Fibrisoma montanum TaxID=2305895 RepID=A0A418MC14_9BACT|nr:fasciclin domain-containing protein [Fibrisoma montanum]RIV23911.1 fasciclin domain-containing protein [Fibrisoma montanum]
MKKIAKLSFVAWAALALPALTFMSCQDQLAEGPQPASRKGARVGVETGVSATQIVVNSADHTLLEAAVIRAGLANALSTGTLTLFAPTDAAFQRAGFADVNAINSADINVLTRILLYHVIGGWSFEAELFPMRQTGFTTLQGGQFLVTRSNTGVSVNGIRVTQGNLFATNGVVHVIDRVLMPPMGNVVETAIANPNLSYLVAAVLRASQGPVNVLQVLGTTPNLTVFAPTNQAFINAGFPTIQSIQTADPAVLTKILTYHVVAVPQFSQFFSANLASGNVPTIQGGNVGVTVSGGGVTVKGFSNPSASNVVIPDVATINGVVHVIDQVLLPQ